MRHNINIQDGVLFGWLKEARKLRFELISGKSVTGNIVRFDRYCVLMETDSGAQLMLYKHALSAIYETEATAKRPAPQHRPRAAVASPGRVALVGQRR